MNHIYDYFMHIFSNKSKEKDSSSIYSKKKQVNSKLSFEKTPDKNKFFFKKNKEEFITNPCNIKIIEKKSNEIKYVKELKISHYCSSIIDEIFRMVRPLDSFYCS